MTPVRDPEQDTIQPVTFVPSGEQLAGPKISVAQALLIVLGLIAAAIVWFLFTSKSVQINFIPPADSVSVSGGMSLEVGGVWLLREGEYDIEAVADLYEPLVTKLSVGNARNQVVELTLTPKPGFVWFDLAPTDATVHLDGLRLTGTERVEIPAGEHEVRVTHPRYQPRAEIIFVEGREQEQTEQIHLLPNWANVDIASTPSGATISIDGEPWPQTTPTTIEALAGEREIAVTLEGYKTYRQRIFAQATDAYALDPIVLEQADAKLRVTSQPARAGVIVNGDFLGRTPLDVDLKSNVNHDVQLVLNGYHSVATTANLSRGEQSNYHASLKREQGKVDIVVEPANARVQVNGRDYGTGSQSLSLPTSSQNIQLTLPGYAAYQQTITPKVGITQQIKVRLLTLDEARLAAITPSITSPSGQTLRLFEPHDFQDGASRREPGRRANEPLRQVTLNKLFYLSTKEVTNAEFRQFATGHDSGEYVEVTLNEDEQPAVNLSWHDAAAYCNWLSQQASLPPFYNMELGKVVSINPNAIGFRLPTEAEWSWAARTTERGELLRFPWGESLPPPDRHGNYADRAGRPLVGRVIFGYNDNYAASAPVGTFKANQHRLYDMGGNVAEWMHDFYAIPKDDGEPNSLGPASGEYHVIKGSSWMHGTITELRYSFRDYGIDGRQDVGFRIARYAE